MPAKIKDLRNRNEELIKLSSMEETLSMGGSFAHHYYSQLAASHNPALIQSGLNSRRDFEDILNLIGDFYSKDPLKLELTVNYWCADSDNLSTSSMYQKPSQKQIALYKFVRYFLSDGALSGSLYMSYINMLTGLSTGEESAQHCFVLLQHNGDFYDAQNPNISWNHIFFAFERYYDSLRVDYLQKQSQNQTNQAAAMRAANIARGNISQQELKALILVIKLVNQIAYYSEKSRIALCEFQRGFEVTSTTNILMPHHIHSVSLPILMFGLLGCPIPVNLKGEILTLLTSLSLTPQIAINMWQALENSQIIQTISTQQQKSGIEAELEEIETKEETYPLLIGFLDFIKILINVKIPENLGVGFRAKGVILGFQPYLQFLVNNVYLKFATRPYKNPQEKWQIASLILEIFLKLIQDYEININDFKFPSTSINQNMDDATTTQAKSPGYRLIYEFIHDGPIVHQLFKILNEALHHLCEYNSENDVQIENSSLVILKLVYIILHKQKKFIECMKSANMNVINTGLENLLIIINSKTNKVDNLMSIFRFIQFSSHLYKHTYYSVSILYELCQYLNINQQLLNFFIGSCTSAREQYDVLHGFVESLEYDDNDILDIDDLKQNVEFIISDQSELNHKEKYCSLTRFKILQLILFNLKLQSLNISHLLLGFDLKRPLNKCEFYLPGTNISKSEITNVSSVGANLMVNRNCLHSIIDKLNALLTNNELLSKMHLTINICYDILNNLCSNSLISNQILHYLRNEYDFIYLHLKQLPFKFLELEKQDQLFHAKTLIDSDMENDGDIKPTLQIQQQNEKQKFLLANTKLNRYIYTANASILYLTCIELKTLIINRMRTQASKLLQLLIDTTQPKNDLMNQTNTLFYQSNYIDQSQQQQQQHDQSSKVYKLLNIIEFNEEFTPKKLNLNYFDTSLTEKVINTCKYKTDLVGTTIGTIELYDVKQIQNILMNEITFDSNIATSKLNILHEIKSIINNINERNQFQLKYASKKRYIDSYKMLIECLIVLIPNEIFNCNLRYTFILNLMKHFLDMVFVDDVLVELTYPIPTVLFTLMCNLKVIIDEFVKQQTSKETSNNVLNTNLLNTNSFYEILNKTVEYLLNPSLSNYKVRTYLYGVIINYLMAFKSLSKIQEASEDTVGFKINSKLLDARDNYVILLANSEALLKYICTDSCEGLTITTMMGLSLLNNLLELDRQENWLRYINDNGYLGCIVNSLQNDNSLLEECFHSDSKNHKVIYVYEAKMALLISIAKSPQGAQYLFNNNLITILSQCSVFHIRTKFDRNIYAGQNAQNLIELLYQFHQILFPALNLCVTMIDSLGLDNIEAKSQVSRFILSHSETILHILTNKIGDVQMLEELKLTTCLLSKLAPFEELNFEMLTSNLSIEYHANLSRIQKELIQLICIFFVPENLKNLRKEIETRLPYDDTAAKKNVRLLCVQVATNICCYCSTMIRGPSLRMSLLIFSPKIKECGTQFGQLHGLQGRLSSKHFPINLLVEFLKYTLDNLEKSIELESDLQSKKERINDLIEIEVKQIVGDYKMFQKLLPHEKQFYLHEQLENIIKTTQDEIKLYTYTIEKLLLILWRHIEFYLAYYEPLNRNIKSYNSYFSNIADGRSQAKEQPLPIDGVTKDDLAKFRHDLPMYLSPSFLKAFINIEEKYIQPKTRSVFISVLIKRIQRIIHLSS